MPEHQTTLRLEAALAHAPEPAAPPELRDEIAATWGLPLGERVEVSFHGGQLDAISGVLDIAAAPAFPWNPREPLRLRIAGFTFSSREIARWTRL